MSIASQQPHQITSSHASSHLAKRTDPARATHGKPVIIQTPWHYISIECKDIIVESKPTGLADQLSLTLVFREPPASHNLRSLRDLLISIPASTSITRRLDIARDLARSVGYVHTFGFVYKNVRPEAVLVFDCSDGQRSSTFLVGFENIRRDEGWTRRLGDDALDKNLYRHASRQGFNSREDYKMHHDLYGLGVCLPELVSGVALSTMTS